jgi:hypothetical protein
MAGPDHVIVKSNKLRNNNNPNQPVIGVGHGVNPAAMRPPREGYRRPP